MKDTLKIFIVISSLLLFGLAVSFSWHFIQKDNLSGIWDDCYYEVTLVISHNFFHYSSLNPNFTTGAVSIKGPFYPFISSLFFFVDGVNMKSARLVNYVFLSMIIFFLALVELKMKKDKSVFSIYLFFLIPFLFNFLQWYLPDYAVLALSILFVWILLKSDYLSKRRFVLLLGFIFGIGQLTKITFFIYVIGPSLYFLFLSYKRYGFSRKILTSVIMSALLSFAVFGWWNIVYFNAQLPDYLNGGWGTVAVKDTYGYNYNSEPEGINFITKIITISKFILTNSKIILALFISSLVIVPFKFIRDKSLKQNMILLFIWYIVPLIFLAWFVNQENRRYIPLFVPIILFISLSFSSILKSKKIIKVVLMILFVSATISIVHWYSIHPPPETDLSDIIEFINHTNYIYIIGENKDNLDYLFSIHSMENKTKLIDYSYSCPYKKNLSTFSHLYCNKNLYVFKRSENTTNLLVIKDKELFNKMNKTLIQNFSNGMKAYKITKCN